MEYIKIIANSILLSLKKLFKKGKWKIEYWQNIHPTVKITTAPSSLLIIKKKVIMERYGLIHVGENACLCIGENVYFNQGAIISCKCKITIGKQCLFGPNVKIYDNNHKFLYGKGVSFEHSVGEIEIGNNCWIASDVVILKGAKIGDNCVIGANCVVSGIIPNNSIVKCNSELLIEEMRK